MKQMLLSVVIGTAMLAPGGTRADDAKKDQDKLKGTWEVTEFVVNGKSIPEAERKGLNIVFADDLMKLEGPAGVGKREYKFKLDPAKKPKAIDTIPQDGAFKGKSVPAIYELQGDTLKLCMPNKETKERPTEFKAPAGSNLGLLVLKRSKS